MLHYKIQMQKLIPVISDIQQIIRKSDVNLEISLPAIAVIGSQSTGKSSLLQSIIGKEFLPKGKGIVTRRPIQIQLCQINSEKEYAEFVQNKGEHYENMDDFRKAIETQTQKVCGANKGISNAPLRLRFYSRKVLDLLLVDLPGIVKNPIGDQPKDIEQQVMKMIKGYIKNPNCIIVAVSKATEDSANSQSLKLAREIDKEGIRTIGVLTQIDLVEENVNVLKQYNTLSNKLLLGHTCVYLRPSKCGLTLEEQCNKQQEFFRRHEQYSHFADKLGVRSLVRTMNMVLVKHIKLELPVIRQSIIFMIENKKSKIAQYGPYDTTKDKKVQGILVLALVSKYVKFFIELIQGRYSESREAIIGGARIEYIFSQIFIKSINRMNPFEYLNDTDIRTAIRNGNGLRKSLFLPQAAFQNLLKTQILRLKLPSLECAHLIHEELRRLIYNIRITQIERYEILNKKIFEVMENLLAKSLSKTEQMIKNLIEIQLGYINTNHPDFIDVISLVKGNPDNRNGFKREEQPINDSDQHNQLHEEQPSEMVPQTFFKFSKRQKNQSSEISQRSDFLDAKLNHIKQNNQKGINEKSKLRRIEPEEPKRDKLDLESFYSSFSQYNTLPRYRLPGVPGVIKVNEGPKLREQTETDMIKHLIVSYFNVVKKNINDSIPKTIVTFLVNHCRNSCEKILVNNLYVEEEFDQLLHEQDYIINERERLAKEITTLKQCLNLINNLDSQLNY